MATRTDTRIYDYYIAGRASAALAAAVHLGVFDVLDTLHATAAQLAERLEVRERPMHSLVGALVGMGLLVPSGDPARFHLADDAEAYLVRGKNGYLGDLIALEVENFLSPRALLDAMAQDAPSVYGGGDPWAAHDADPVRAERFTEAMHAVSSTPAAALARANGLLRELQDCRHLLDVGGGSGAVAIAIAEAWPAAQCTVLDRAAVLPTTEKYFAASEAVDRLHTVAADMFVDEYPDDLDVILYSQILHDWPPDSGHALLEKAFRALPPGGVCLVHEKLIEADGGPLANALVHLDMLVWTEGQQLTVDELTEQFEEAGFRHVRRVQTAGYWSVVVGHKPSRGDTEVYAAVEEESP